jgi:hypothetical protein
MYVLLTRLNRVALTIVKVIKDRKNLGMIPPKVIEPTGEAAERDAYWKTVWKLGTLLHFF